MFRKYHLLTLSFILIARINVLLAQIPSNQQGKSILLLGGYAHIGNGKTIEESAIGFKDGKITMIVNLLTNSIDSTLFDTIIDIKGKHVYPGFIATNSTIGLREIDEVKASLDFKETGSLNPHIRSLIAYNAESKLIPTIRSNGVLIAQVVPKHGIITGTSSIFELDGWNWEDAVLKADDGIHLNWPKSYNTSKWWEGSGDNKKNTQKENSLHELYAFFVEAKAYCQLKNSSIKNLRYEAMRGVFGGTKNIYINADYVKDLLEIVSFVREFNLTNVSIIGGQDAWMISEVLKENSVSVSLNRIHELPQYSEDDIDLPYKRPYLLKETGILFCLNYEGDMEAMGSRNLPFVAGTAAAYGLSKEEALKAITLDAAKILGIDNRVGSIEIGKDATIFVSKGDALDMKTNEVFLAFIRGKSIDLDTHQKQLYRKYSTKYDLKP